MADAKISSLAAAASVATTTVVPVVRSGAGVTEKATLSQVAGVVANDATAFTQTGTGAAARSITAKLRDDVSIWDFGVVGDGTADDTTPWVNALATGKNVIDERGGTYRTTAGLTLSTVGQRIIGAGKFKTIFTPAGSFNAFSMTAPATGIEHIQVNGASHSGGKTFNLQGANNSRIAHILGSACFNMFYIDNCNMVEIDGVWSGNNKGQYSVQLFGNGITTSGTRSDVIAFKNVIISADATVKPVGLLWDGNVHSVMMHNVAFLSGHSYAIRIRNTSGGTPPTFLQGHAVNLEYCEYGLYSEVGTQIEITNLYSFGHTVGDGVNFSATLGAGVLRLANARLGGNAGYGIQMASGSTAYVTNLLMDSNTTGTSTGSVLNVAPGFMVDANFYLQILSSNPVLAFDANDFISYDRASDIMAFSAGATAALSLSSTVVDAVLPLRLPTYTVAGLPSAATYIRCMVYVSNGTANKRLAISDGTNWRFPDGAIVS